MYSVRVFVCSPQLSHSQRLRRPRRLILLIDKKAGVRLKISPLTVFSPIYTHAHPHTLVHRHSHTVSSISAASQQQVPEDRGHLCARLPFFSSASGHLCWEKTGREGQATDSVSASVSTPPPQHKISLIKMHEHWHHELHLSIPPFLPVPCDYLFPNICSLATASLSPSTASPLPLCLLAPVSIMHPMHTHTHAHINYSVPCLTCSRPIQIILCMLLQRL